MKKSVIKIPSGVRYLGDAMMKELMPEFKFETGIYAKEQTGCGATTFALRDDVMDTVLFVPRKVLLFNKAEQTPDVQQVWGDITNDEISRYLETHTCRRKVFISTYDSAPRLRNLLGGSWEGYHLYIDEFHVLLSDCGFKSYTELEFVEIVRDAELQTWISATPCLDTLLEQMPHLSTLPFYQLDWEDKHRVKVQCVQVNSPIDALANTVKMYQEGNFPTYTYDDGTCVESHTMNAMFSSVNGIARVVRACGLTPENTTLIVSPTDENVEALAKLGFKVGRIPLRGESRTMFTLCTSTAYMGMDFYGTDTTTFVIADCRQVNTSVDIATELVQIAGRERLEENPFRGDIVFFYNTWRGNSSYETLMEALDDKLLTSQKEVELLNSIDDPSLKEKQRKTITNEKRAMGDAQTYTYWNNATSSFEVNELSVLYDQHMARVQFSIYHDGNYLFNEVNAQQTLEVDGEPHELEIRQYVRYFTLKKSFEDKMRHYCELRVKQDSNPYYMGMMERQTPSLKTYYDTLGYNRIMELACKENKLQKEMMLKRETLNIHTRLKGIIKPGDEKTPAEWKQLLRQVYDEQGLTSKNATATQLEKDWGFKMKKHHRTGEDGQRYYTYEIIEPNEL